MSSTGVTGSQSKHWSSMLNYIYRGEVVIVEGVPISNDVFEYLARWLDKTENRYESDVIKKAVTILSKSLRELNTHKIEEFVPYGDYRIFDGLAAQLKQEFDDPYFAPRPYLITLYGPPGTGKTTWVRNVAKKYLMEDGVLRGIYLEVTSGDLQSKWAGVPINTMKSILECIKTPDQISILLFDEADAILVRPENVSSGVSLEQMQLVAEMKSQLSFITSQNIPTLIALTTNYKDVISKADPALADRVIAWINVPPPPTEVKEKIVSRVLSRIFRNIWFRSNPLGQLTILRALQYNSPSIYVKEKGNISFRWRLPTLPFDADYIIGYLSAWGWNPLDENILPALETHIREAIILWRTEEPFSSKLLRVYTRGLITTIEIAKFFIEKSHGMPKSFLRAYAVLKRGIEDIERLFTQIYTEGLDNVMEALKAGEEEEWGRVKKALYKLKQLGLDLPEEGSVKDILDEVKTIYSEALRDGLFTNPIPPIIMHMLLAKYLVSKEFYQIVNDIHSMLTYITVGIRDLFLPAILISTDNVYDATANLWIRLYYYNKLVKQELLKGRLLEPLRIMYREKDAEVAWREAVKSLRGIDDRDLQISVAIALLPLKHLHPAIHAEDSEEKARILYETYKDRNNVEKIMWETAKQLEIQEYIYPVLKPHPISGIYVWKTGKVRVAELSILHNRIFDEFRDNIYHPAFQIDDIGTIAAGPYLLSKEVLKKRRVLVN